MRGPCDIRDLGSGFNGKPGWQMVCDLVALQLWVVDIDERSALVLRNEGVARVRFKKRPGRKKRLPVAVPRFPETSTMATRFEL
jgi:hypothetical protein